MGRTLRLSEMNGFPPWFPDLTRAQPAAVRTVLAECIAAEWEIAANRPHPSLTLYKLAWGGEGANSLLRGVLFQRFEASEPANDRILPDPLAVLLEPVPPPAAELAVLASARSEEVPVCALSFTTWMVFGCKPTLCRPLHRLSVGLPPRPIPAQRWCAFARA